MVIDKSWIQNVTLGTIIIAPFFHSYTYNINNENNTYSLFTFYL